MNKQRVSYHITVQVFKKFVYCIKAKGGWVGRERQIYFFTLVSLIQIHLFISSDGASPQKNNTGYRALVHKIQ